MAGEIGIDQIAERREIRRFVGKADEDIAADRLAVDLLQAVLGLVEILRHVACEEQRTVKFVSPLVVGTDELGGGALVLRAHTRTAVAAGIVKGANGAGPVAGDDDGIIAHLHREIIAGLGDLAVVADEKPVAVPDRLKIELVVVGVDVEGLLEAVAFAPVLELAEHVAVNVHAGSSEYPKFAEARLRRRHPAASRTVCTLPGRPPQPVTIVTPGWFPG